MKFYNEHSIKHFKKKSLEYMSCFLYEKTYQKGAVILNSDDVFRNILFVKSGVVCQYNTEFAEFTIEYNQNEMICSTKAFKKQQCLGSELIALEDTTIYCFSYYNYKKICLAYPRFEYMFGLMIAHFNYLKMNIFLGSTTEINLVNYESHNLDSKVIFLENIFKSCA